MNTSFLKAAATSLASCAIVALAACGGGGGYGGGGGGGGGGGTTYTVGGMVSGLAGSGLVLRDNGGDDLAVSASGSFTFTTKVANAAAYAVTVYTQPTSPSQTCTVTSGSGTMGSSNVTNVAVTCTTNKYTVGGTVSGLTGTGLVLRDNGGDDLAVTSGGSFTFATAVPSGAAYGVTVQIQPTSPSQTCMVTSGNGTVGGSAVTNVAVACATNFSPATVNGVYLGVGYQVSNDTGSLGTVTYDGSGNFNVTAVVANVAGVIGPVPSYSGTYTVAADGALNASSGGGTIEGGISADSHTLVFAQVTSGQSPSFAVNIKQGQTGFTNANLTGTYRLVAYEDQGTSGNLVTFAFDGAGNFSASGTRNQSGIITNTTATGTYTVAADGTATLMPGGGGTPLKGGVSADGNTLVFSQTTVVGPKPATFIGIKQGQTNATNASLKGRYKLFSYDGSSNNVALLTLVADGAGNVAGTQVLNSAGVIANTAIATTYTVTADGTVTIANGSAPPILGYLSADGYTIVAADMHAGDFPTCTVGVRQ